MAVASKNKLRRYPSVDDMLMALNPSYPVMCFWPDLCADVVRQFTSGFPGKVMYAVKCNPHPLMLSAIYGAGIRSFDTASLGEIALINELFDDVSCYFNHPVKGRAAIESAVRVFGIRDFVVDHPAELDKLTAIAQPDAAIQVRLRTPSGVATFDLSAKFGADPAMAVELLQSVDARGYRPALSFHVGSQCVVPKAYRTALEIVADVIDKSGVTPAYINVGGGFPACGMEQTPPPLGDYFDEIRKASAQFGFSGEIPLICEPGRAIVARAASLVVQVHLRKDDRLYLNDGVFGCLSELVYGGIIPPMRPVRMGKPHSDELQPFTLFGPTCDSSDVAPSQFALPVDMAEGDWIEIRDIGAYSNALQTNFNGFHTDTFVEIHPELG